MTQPDIRYTKDDLTQFQPRHDRFVGIDSDGCVFDTMEVKQKIHFHPQILKTWGLEKIEKPVRAAAEFVNLYSKWRGANRFPALLKVFELLREMPEAAAGEVAVPDASALEKYVNSGLSLGNPSLKEEVARTGDPELKTLLSWSLAVNEDIAQNMEEIPPFPWAKECLEKLRAHCDAIVVSQTPEEALVKEWQLHGIDGYVAVIAGQELGTKAEHLQMAAGGKYEPEKILMIGDAPGDRRAADAVKACFYPVNPGREEASWECLYKEALDRFLSGDYHGDYEQQLIDEFEALLPETPTWKS